jgi:anti-sigma B factor antagonist
MEIKIKIRDDIGVIILQGKLMGLPNTDKLNAEVKGLLKKNINKIVLDLHDVDWINSSGIGAIMRSFISVKNVVGDLRLARISKKVAQVLDLTQLIKIFKPYDTLQEAISSLRS